MCCSWSYWLIWVLEWKFFLGNVTVMYTVKALQRSYNPSLTLSRLLLWKTYVKRIYWILSSLQEMAIITMTIKCICMKKANWLKHPLLSRRVSQIAYSSIAFIIWWLSSSSIQTSMEDLCHQQFFIIYIVQINI